MHTKELKWEKKEKIEKGDLWEMINTRSSKHFISLSLSDVSWSKNSYAALFIFS